MNKYRVVELKNRFIIEVGIEKRVYFLGIFPTFKKKIIWTTYYRNIPIPLIFGMGCISLPQPHYRTLNSALGAVNDIINPVENKPKYHYPKNIIKTNN